MYSNEIRWVFRFYSSNIDGAAGADSGTEEIGVDGNEDVYMDVDIGEATSDGVHNGGFELHDGNVLFNEPITGVKIVASGKSARLATMTKTLVRRLYSATEVPAKTSWRPNIESGEPDAQYSDDKY